MDTADLVFAGPIRQAELVAAGGVTPRALVDACLERIERLDPQLNAFRVVLAEQARAEADALGAPDGRPLFGVPVAIKDDQDVAGQATQFGTGVAMAPAASDGELVRRLREAGAIVIGKTNVPELTIWPWTESAAQGITRNPWRQDRITGGSSGGSAAAVAAGMVGVATASDGLGSIRIPAACCGLFGLKPQKDRVSIAPKTAATGWHGLTHYGVLTRGVRDAAYVLDAVADRRPAEPFLSAAGRTPRAGGAVPLGRGPHADAPARRAVVQDAADGQGQARSRGARRGRVGGRHAARARARGRRARRPVRGRAVPAGHLALVPRHPRRRDRHRPGRRARAQDAGHEARRRRDAGPARRQVAPRGARVRGAPGRVLRRRRRAADAADGDPPVRRRHDARARHVVGLQPRLDVRAVSGAVERDRAAGGLGPSRLERRRCTARRAARRAHRRRGDAAVTCRAARGGTPVDRPPSAELLAVAR